MTTHMFSSNESDEPRAAKNGSVQPACQRQSLQFASSDFDPFYSRVNATKRKTLPLWEIGRQEVVTDASQPFDESTGITAAKKNLTDEFSLADLRNDTNANTVLETSQIEKFRVPMLQSVEFPMPLGKFQMRYLLVTPNIISSPSLSLSFSLSSRGKRGEE